jgi:mono/diheme cytochrome c family protein
MKTAAFFLAAALGLGAAFALAGELPGPAAVAQDTLKNPVAATAASLAKGKSLFSKNCASCHGAKGNGDSPTGKAFTPPARDFTDTTWQGRKTDRQIFVVIAQGIPGTGMVPFEKNIKEGDRWNLVNYIRSFKVKGVKAGK